MTRFAILLSIILLLPIQLKSQLDPDSLLRVAQKSDDPEHKINVYYSLIEYYLGFNQKKAIEIGTEILQYLEENNINKAIGAIHSYLGEAYYILDDAPTSLFHFKEQLKANEATKDQHGIASAYNNIGIVYSSNKDYDNAIKCYEDALRIYEELSLIEGISTTINNLGVLYENKEDLKTALEYYERSYNIEKELGNYREIATSLLNLGSLYNKFGQHYKAIEYCKESISIADTLNLTHTLELNYSSLYESYKATGNSNEALLFLEKMLELKDLRINEESSELVAELSAKYQNEKKIQEIEFLNEQNSDNKKVIITIIIGLISSLGFLVLLLIENKVKRKKNTILKFQNQEINQQKEEIQAQRDEIEAQRNLALEQRDAITYQKQHITDSINYAEHIQSALLPNDDELEEILNDGFCFFKPLDIVSGDFYWLRNIDEFSVIITSDCTGHGVPGAFMSIMGINFLNNLIIERGMTDPGTILNKMNDKIRDTFSHEKQEFDSFNGMDITISVLNRKTLEHRYACAKNKLVKISDNKLTTFAGLNRSLGRPVVQDKLYETYTDQLKKGDIIYSFSDGFLDQIGGPLKTKFRRDQFNNLLFEIHSKPMKDQAAILEETFNKWMNNYDAQIDDVLVLGFKA